MADDVLPADEVAAPALFVQASASDPATIAAEVNGLVSDLLVRQLGLTMHLAPQSRDADGEVWCCNCHSRDGLKLVAPGWGGVYACRDCHPRTAKAL